MKINNKSTKKPLIIAVTVLVTVALFAGAFLILQQNNQSQSTENAKKQQEADNKDKKDFIEGTNEDGSASKDTPPLNTSPSPTTDTPLKVSAKSETNGSITILTQAGSLSEGACTLKITNTNRTISKTAPIIYQEQYSSCAGFTITNTERTDLGAGDWEIELTVISAGTTYTTKASFGAS